MEPPIGEDEREPPRGARTEFSRRQALGLIGGGTLALGLSPAVGKLQATSTVRQAIAQLAEEIPALEGINPSVIEAATIFRAKDMVRLGFLFANLKIDVSTSPPQLIQNSPKSEPILVAIFPPQHVGEEAIAAGASPPDSTWVPPPLEASLSGYSWLAFTVPKTALPIPYTVEGLLDWSGLTPSLLPVAIPTKGSKPTAVSASRTAIEAPWQLYLSPDPKGGWNHSTTPVTHNGITELWQTRLGVGKVEPPVAKPLIRAVWTPNLPYGEDAPFLMSLSGLWRAEIVQLTTEGRSLPGIAKTTPPTPIPADLFMLTPLGASMRLKGHWPLPGFTSGARPRAANYVNSLTDWRHETSTGRDYYVRIVEAGFIFPFGHRAVKITITDRELQFDTDGDTDAYLVQRTYVVVVQTQINYPGKSPEPSAGRQNPFRQVTIKTPTTPPLDPTGITVSAGSNTLTTDQACWVRYNGADFPFAHEALDHERRTVDFHTGAIWVNYSDANDKTTIDTVIAAYAAASADRRTPSLGGQTLAFAKTNGTPGSTAQHTDSVELGGEYVAGLVGSPSWFPVMVSAVVHLPGAESVAGGSSIGGATVEWFPNYREHDFAAGHPEIYLQMKSGSTLPGLTFPASVTGGSTTPNFSISSIARDLGPLGGTASDLFGGTFKPSDFFAGLGAKLLGAIDLADIIAAVDPSTSQTIAQSPKLKSTLIYPKNDTSKPPIALQTTLDWTPKVSASPLGIFVPDTGSKLTIHAKIYAPIKDPSKTTYAVHGQLTNFTLTLFGTDDMGGSPYIGVSFKGVTFDSKTGSKTSLKPDIDTVTFEGPLTFVNALESLLASLGGPTIAISDGGIEADYSLPIPSVGVGIFALENLKLTAGFTIPFDGSPVRVRFYFCTRDDPFILSISLFAGGGFFGIALGGDGIEIIEASLEFGASLSIDLGVASGGVSIMAGIYFKLVTSPKQVTLTGFLRADGNLEVLGIISISVEFYLGFTYLDPGKATGTATVSLTVKVLFFSATVSATMQKTIGGSGDPTFAQAISTDDWDQYCDAFA